MRFKVGQRVLYTSPGNPKIKNWFHAADMGQPDVVMHLNARDENGRIKPITGTVRKVSSDNKGGTDISFAPDGWQPRSENSPYGFSAPEGHFQELEDESLILPGTIVKRNSK